MPTRRPRSACPGSDGRVGSRPRGGWSSGIGGRWWVPASARWEAIRAQAKQADIGVRIDAALEATLRQYQRSQGLVPDAHRRAEGGVEHGRAAIAGQQDVAAAGLWRAPQRPLSSLHPRGAGSALCDGLRRS